MKTHKHISKRAFTLTELLIVVIVIGVLSAVTLPKFNRVIENRKVTEAEEMMSAVRTEQERRCSLDQNYTTKFSNLQDIIASNDTKNYTYSLQPQGISAQSKSAGYTLKILSYEDGSYCCEGDGCKKLNKNYPDCAGLSFPQSDCVGTDNSGGDGLGPDPTPEPGVKECVEPAPASSEKCSPCGETRTRTVTCVNGEWEVGAWSASCKTQDQCPITCPEPKPATTEECEPCGETRTRSVTCGSNGQWTIGDWNAECKTECEKETCGSAYEQGTLTAFCKSKNMFPYDITKYPEYADLTLTATCCYNCEQIDNCTVDQNGECVKISWFTESGANKLAVRYGNSPTAQLNPSGTFMGESIDRFNRIYHYGNEGASSPEGKAYCDFSVPGGETISVADIGPFSQQELREKCEQHCTGESCSYVIYPFAKVDSYGVKGWATMYESSTYGADAACALSELGNVGMESAAQLMQQYDSISISCGSGTKTTYTDYWQFRDKYSSIFTSYPGMFKVDLSSAATDCETNEPNPIIGCKRVSGIPANTIVPKEPFSYGVEGGCLKDGTGRCVENTNCTVDVQVGSIKVAGVVVSPTTCQYNPEGGQPCL